MKSADVSLVGLIERFGSDEKCRTYLEVLRWPDGLECPRCQGKTISRIAKRDQFDCDSCRYQFSVTAGTIFHDTKLPLWKWFLATYVICESKQGVSSNQLKRMLNVSYKTAWYLSHRIRATMKDEGADVHTNTVEGVWSLLKRSVVGSYHQLSAKHLPAYLDEMAFRFNNRENPYLFRDTLIKLVESDNLAYKALIS